MTKTYFPTGKKKREPKWWLVDAKGKVLGRLASRIAPILCGKENPAYTPHHDMGDYVVVINAQKLVMRGNEKMEQKFYAKHTGYPSGLKIKTARQVFEKHPERLLLTAVSGMMPKTRLGENMLKKLRVYSDVNHPHTAQKLESLNIE